MNDNSTLASPQPFKVLTSLRPCPSKDHLQKLVIRGQQLADRSPRGEPMLQRLSTAATTRQTFGSPSLFNESGFLGLHTNREQEALKCAIRYLLNFCASTMGPEKTVQLAGVCQERPAWNENENPQSWSHDR